MKLWPGIHIGFGITFAYASKARSVSFIPSRIRYNNCWSYWWWRFVVNVPAKQLYEIG